MASSKKSASNQRLAQLLNRVETQPSELVQKHGTLVKQVCELLGNCAIPAAQSEPSSRLTPVVHSPTDYS